MSQNATDAHKRLAAAAALEFVRPDARLGLGTGSTATQFVTLLGERARDGFAPLCVPTSEGTRRQAEKLGLRLSTLDETPELDLVVDGADEIDPQLRLIKGAGGALLREKIVAAAARRMIVIADSGKLVHRLGASPLPVEIDPFGFTATRLHVAEAARTVGLSGSLRRRETSPDRPFVTDGGHWILDCAFGAIPSPEALAAQLAAIPGVIEHGLFIGLATLVLLGGPEGVTRLEKTP